MADDHSHHHNHSHLHDYHPASLKRTNAKPLVLALVLTATYLIAEVVGGVLSNPLALLDDAGHIATDVAALGLALFAVWLARRPASENRSFGFYRAEVLAALLNAAILLVVSVYIFWEAFARFHEPPEISTMPMLLVATGGLVINIVSAWVLSRGGAHNHSLNTRGAYLHVLGDMLGSIAAIAAAVIIMFTWWNIADPILSAGIGVLVLWSAWRLLRESVDVLLESTPRGIHPSEIKEALGSIDGVTGVHDLHIWTVSSGIHALSGHVDVVQSRPWQEILLELNEVLRRKFGITHVTLQPESASEHCDVEDGCAFES